MKFAFENLEVYQRSIKLVSSVEHLAEELKGRISYPFIDQMTRAALSVPLNLAEGNGRWHKNDKKNFFWIARGSVFELVPLVQLFHNKGLIDSAVHESIREDLQVIAKMITALVISIDSIRN